MKEKSTAREQRDDMIAPFKLQPASVWIHSGINNSKNGASLNEIKIGELFNIEAVI